jgi:hypothetical protein
MIFIISEPMPLISSNTEMESDRFVLYFNHIPKTGGTSLTLWLHSLFLGAEIVPDLHIHPDRRISLVKSGLQFISGHHACTVHGDGSGGFHEITWLREPRAWIRSFYKYFLTFDFSSLDEHHQADDSMRRIKEMSYPKFIDHYCLQKNGLVGYQSRYLYSMSSIQLDRDKRWNVREKSRKRIKEFAFVGSLGHMQESVDLFCHRFRLPPKKFLHWENRSRGGIDFTSADEEKFLKNNPDVSLYRRIDEKVCLDHANMAYALGLGGVGAGADVLHDAIRRDFCENGNPHFHKRCLREGLAMLGDGWGPELTWGKIQPRQIRWARQSRSFDVYVPIYGPSDHSVEFNLLYYLFNPNGGSLSLRIDGDEIDFSLSSASDEDYPHAMKLRALIPASRITHEARFLHLVIEVSVDAYAQAAGKGGDTVNVFATDAIRVRTVG